MDGRMWTCLPFRRCLLPSSPQPRHDRCISGNPSEATLSAGARKYDSGIHRVLFVRDVEPPGRSQNRPGVHGAACARIFTFPENSTNPGKVRNVHGWVLAPTQVVEPAALPKLGYTLGISPQCAVKGRLHNCKTSCFKLRGPVPKTSC